ncbi:MAG: MgtC/SapB family protein [Euryarchaeota archaeon]|nr:MgtC/SapB family protein [Euryarchaeota archaeon]
MVDVNQLLFDFLPKIGVAILCGSLIGFERELKEKPAGLRTYVLVTLGACLFQLVGMELTRVWVGATDPTRVASQVVTGIGFLGAGAIILSRGHVKGMTTAATIWFSAGVGVGVGSGLYELAILITLVAVGVLVLLTRVESQLHTKDRHDYKCSVLAICEGADEKVLAALAKHGRRVKVTGLSKGKGICEISFTAREDAEELAALQREMTAITPELTFKSEMAEDG